MEDNYKLWEIETEEVPPLCISIRENKEGQASTVELHGCHRNSAVINVQWQVPPVNTTEWIYDIDDGMIIDVKSSNC